MSTSMEYIQVNEIWEIQCQNTNKGCLQNIGSNLKGAKYLKSFLIACWKWKSCQNAPEHYLLLSQKKQVVWTSWKRCSFITTCLNSEYMFTKKVNSYLQLFNTKLITENLELKLATLASSKIKKDQHKQRNWEKQKTLAQC